MQTGPQERCTEHQGTPTAGGLPQPSGKDACAGQRAQEQVDVRQRRGGPSLISLVLLLKAQPAGRGGQGDQPDSVAGCLQ